MNFDEAFKILEIEPTDDKKKIKIAYSKMLKKYHPEEFPEMFMKINEAYRVALEFEKFDFNEVKSESETAEKNDEDTEFFERVKKDFEENKEKSFFGNFEDIFSDEKNKSEFENIFSNKKIMRMKKLLKKIKRKKRIQIILRKKKNRKNQYLSGWSNLENLFFQKIVHYMSTMYFCLNIIIILMNLRRSKLGKF